MVYLAELSVIMTDRLNNVRIRARNVSCIQGRKRFRRRRVCRVSLAPVNRRRCVLDAPGRRPLEIQKTRPGTSKQETCHNSMPSSHLRQI